MAFSLARITRHPMVLPTQPMADSTMATVTTSPLVTVTLTRWTPIKRGVVDHGARL